MAEKNSQNHNDDKGKRYVDTPETDFHCLINKDDYLGFVGKGGVFLNDYKIENGKWTWYGTCG